MDGRRRSRSVSGPAWHAPLACKCSCASPASGAPRVARHGRQVFLVPAQLSRQIVWCEFAAAQASGNPHFPQSTHSGSVVHAIRDVHSRTHMKKDPTPTLCFVLLEDDPSDAELIQLELARNGLAV